VVVKEIDVESVFGDAVRFRVDGTDGRCPHLECFAHQTYCMRRLGSRDPPQKKSTNAHVSINNGFVRTHLSFSLTDRRCDIVTW
jgi:hypothetical protein